MTWPRRLDNTINWIILYPVDSEGGFFFVGKFPTFFNFSDSMEKIYLVELNIFKENAIYGLQKILLDSFSRNKISS